MEIRRQVQEVGHCGPTCVSMLLEAHAIRFSQRTIAEAAGVRATVSERGSRVDQLALAVEELAPEVVLLGRFHSTIAVIDRVITTYGIAVGVEWQGRFNREDGSQFDIGHFSLVAGVDEDKGALRLIDPDDKSIYAPGAISIREFVERWWEDNLLESGRWGRSYRLAFLIAEKSSAEKFDPLGFKPISYEMVARSSIGLER